jgi:hypothetical protein
MEELIGFLFIAGIGVSAISVLLYLDARNRERSHRSDHSRDSPGVAKKI